MKAKCQRKTVEGVLFNNILFPKQFKFVSAKGGFMLKSTGDTPALGLFALATNLHNPFDKI